MSIASVMPSNHLILCCPLLLLPSIFPRTRVFSSESAVCIMWPKYWNFSFSFSLSNIQGWFPLKFTGLIFLLSKGLSRVFSNTTVRKLQFSVILPSLWSFSPWSCSMSLHDLWLPLAYGKISLFAIVFFLMYIWISYSVVVCLLIYLLALREIFLLGGSKCGGKNRQFRCECWHRHSLWPWASGLSSLSPFLQLDNGYGVHTHPQVCDGD